MSTTPVPFSSLTALSRAVDELLFHRGMRTRSSVFSLCIEAVAFGREVESPDVAMRSRSAGHLLIQLAHPELDEAVISALALACEEAAVGVA